MEMTAQCFEFPLQVDRQRHAHMNKEVSDCIGYTLCVWQMPGRSYCRSKPCSFLACCGRVTSSPSPSTCHTGKDAAGMLWREK